MKKLIVVLISAILSCSCHSNEDKRKIIEQADLIQKYENERSAYKNSQAKFETEKNSKSYVFIVIDFVKASKRFVPAYRDPNTYEILIPSYEAEDLDTLKSISIVLEKTGWNDDEEFKSLDNMQVDMKREAKFKNYYIKSIVQRKAYVYKTYKEASIALEDYQRQTSFTNM